ncbi:geranylgeranyl reductase family protein [Kineosporia rhizophila]|uniref:NAD(P)/FAD-dependent oxidoreductase n=1 Tax=Kineosporia rhizophila TaxID=84633 RepID=UPI001E4F7BBC|nr:geranylgeranyl reductase family protein [Kineosporia rhizophila]MCE0534657.1 geranylgeranyl reductase family protein [Kineosporia rhizophila]
MSEVADVLVVGAGPAGASAALAARQTDPAADVRLLDLADFPRDKVCGDGIAPHALAELRRLGVTGLAEGYGPIHTLDLRSPGGLQLKARAPEPMYVIPRAVFDARLVAAAQAAGVTLVRHRARTLEQHRTHVRVDNEHAGKTLVIADGANSTLRRALNIPRNPDQHMAVAIRGYAPEHPADHLDPAQSIVMQDDAWPAYAWSFPLVDGSGTANIGYGRLRSALRSRRQLEEELTRLLPGRPAERLRAHHLPLATWRPRQPDGRVLLAGDAASLINPLTGEGIFYAVRSGRLAGQEAARAAARERTATTEPTRANPGRAYREALRAELGRHLRHTSWLARLSAHPGAVDAAVAAAQARPETLHRLIDLGLGDGVIPARLAPPVLLHFARGRLLRLPASTGRAR